MTEPGDIFSAAFRRFPAAAWRQAALIPGPMTGDSPFLEGTCRSLLPGAIDATARFLDAAGIRAGDRVAWLGWNDPMQLVLLAACARIGAVQVPLNWRLTTDELRWIEADAGFRVLCTPNGRRRPAPRFEHPYVADFLARRGREPGCRVSDPLDEVGVHRTAAMAAPPTADAAAPLLLCYTSGTSGRPKGAVLTQGSVAANARNATAIFGLAPADTVLTVLPMFHAGGLNIQTVPALLAGACVILHTRFYPDAFFNAVAEWRPTLSLLVPTVMQALIRHPRWDAADLSCFRAIGAGSSPVPPELILAFHAKGVPIQQVYGATETGPIAIAQTRAEALAAPGSIGRPAPEAAARIVGPDGTPLAAGETGQIEVRGPALMQGYRGAPPLGEAWFATGDAGRADADGRFWFTDRLTAVIISGGENVYPAEVERVLLQAPGVLEAAVCGRPDPRWGEVPVAVVVAAPGFDRAAVLDHCAGRIARFKQPRDLLVVDALPRTALGKVKLAELRALVAPSAAPSAAAG